MSGPAGYARDRDAAAAARELLDATVRSADAWATGQRALLADLLAMWPSAAWIAAGCRTAKQWLLAYTTVSGYEAMRYEQTAELCHHHPDLAEAVLSGVMPMRRAWVLARAVTPERAAYLGPALPALLKLDRDSGDDEAFATGVRYWAERVDEVTAPRRVVRHSLVMTPSLFGGGEAHAHLGPSAFANFCSAIDAYTQDPDPAHAPYQRPLSERRADALDDICAHALQGSGDDPLDHTTDEDDDIDFEELRATDTWDGMADHDELDQRLAAEQAGEPIDDLEALRRRIRVMEKSRRRRMRRKTRMRSGATANVVVDVRTLFGLRDRDDLSEWDLEDLVLRGDGWAATRALLERMRCDAGLVAALFDGKRKILDANARAEQFTRSQRRALAARDGGCVFPGCSRPARHCDAHHLHERSRHGPTITANAALLCRFHHRLVHEHRWRLRIEDDQWVAVDPHGTTWTGRPAPPGHAAA